MPSSATRSRSRKPHNPTSSYVPQYSPTRKEGPMKTVSHPDSFGPYPQPVDPTTQITSDAPDTGSTLVLWQPRPGPEVLALLDHLNLPTASAQALLHSSLDILARCIPPDAADGVAPGLVIGHIHSGRTMSFTAVPPLARDNGYTHVIIITGTA